MKYSLKELVAQLNGPTIKWSHNERVIQKIPTECCNGQPVKWMKNTVLAQ